MYSKIPFGGGVTGTTINFRLGNQRFSAKLKNRLFWIRFWKSGPIVHSRQAEQTDRVCAVSSGVRTAVGPVGLPGPRSVAATSAHEKTPVPYRPPNMWGPEIAFHVPRQLRRDFRVSSSRPWNKKTSANQLPKRDPEINNLPNAHNTYVHSTHPPPPPRPQ